jgi:hypothetical protein
VEILNGSKNMTVAFYAIPAEYSAKDLIDKVFTSV